MNCSRSLAIWWASRPTDIMGDKGSMETNGKMPRVHAEGHLKWKMERRDRFQHVMLSSKTFGWPESWEEDYLSPLRWMVAVTTRVPGSLCINDSRRDIGTTSGIWNTNSVSHMFWDEVSGCVLRPKFELGGYLINRWRKTGVWEVANGWQLGSVWWRKGQWCRWLVTGNDHLQHQSGSILGSYEREGKKRRKRRTFWWIYQISSKFFIRIVSSSQRMTTVSKVFKCESLLIVPDSSWM